MIRKTEAWHVSGSHCRYLNNVRRKKAIELNRLDFSWFSGIFPSPKHMLVGRLATWSVSVGRCVHECMHVNVCVQGALWWTGTGVPLLCPKIYFYLKPRIGSGSNSTLTRTKMSEWMGIQADYDSKTWTELVSFNVNSCKSYMMTNKIPASEIVSIHKTLILQFHNTQNSLRALCIAE